MHGENGMPWSFMSARHIDAEGEWAADGEGGQWVSDDRHHIRFCEDRPSSLGRDAFEVRGKKTTEDRGGWMDAEAFKVSAKDERQKASTKGMNASNKNLMKSVLEGGSAKELHVRDDSMHGRPLNGGRSMKELRAHDHQHHMARFH